MKKNTMIVLYNSFAAQSKIIVYNDVGIQKIYNVSSNPDEMGEEMIRYIKAENIETVQAKMPKWLSSLEKEKLYTNYGLTDITWEEIE